MDKQFDYLILTILVVAIFILMGVTFKTCQFIKEIDVDTTMETAQISISDEEDEDADILISSDEDLADEDENKMNEEDELDYIKTVEETNETPAADITQDEVADTPRTETNASGKYLVIAGTYSQKSNAQIQYKKLDALGYNPELVQFKNSTYHSVCVSRHNTKEDAKELIQDLKSNNGIAAYIHTKKD